MKFMVTTGRPHTDPEDETGVASEPSLEELVGLLFRLTGDLRQLFSERSADLDLTFSQAMALHELDQPLLMRELPQRLCCDASNVPRLLAAESAAGGAATGETASTTTVPVATPPPTTKKPLPPTT